MKPLLLTALMLLLSAVPACAASTISGEQARELVSRRGALLLDVRTPEEFAAGHVDGAKNVPVQVLDAELARLPAKKNQPIVVYCRSGGRSARAAAMLGAAGFTQVHDLGAMSNW
ncbi:MAG: rhodanese-like domain-containing protein [Myxococcaceae bacterium]|nr:rhodanese-like domain-containing protein [Myxococcaceae bacterium]